MTRLKYERLRKGWSLQTVGYKSGVQGSEISKIERRISKPYPGQRARLAKVFGLDPGALLDDITGDEDTLLEARHG